ncbi:MAG: PGF-CTERM sorting domain-containing protein [Candidatus Methanoperedens sp.]|nr:PGF-CTERM sorting domain-containing protein [Candidatus Methanoperedens sp.]
MTVDPGENIRFTLTVEPEDNFNEPVEIYVKTEALGIEKDYGRVKIINPPYKPYVFEKQVPDSIPKGTTITGYVTAKSGGLERDAGTVTVNVPGFGMLLAIGALGMAILLRKRK